VESGKNKKKIKNSYINEKVIQKGKEGSGQEKDK